MLESGQELSARFVLVRRLATGGSGEVWLAQDRERSCLVALKVLADDLSRDDAALAALQDECARARSLGHDNILRVDAVYRSAEHAWIAMEYASGGDLSRLRSRSCAEIVRAVAPIARALSYAHAAGVVHRDLKPGNVLLMADGTPKLTDFGMAATLAQTAVAGGSPYSMSPQQLDGAPPSVADDIYSFGSMLYELLSGYPPFYPEITPARVRSEKPAVLSDADIPASLARLVEQCLAKEPQQRPADMKEVEQRLNAAMTELPAPTIVRSAEPPRVEPPSVRPPQHGEPLRGEWRRNSGSAANADELRRQGFRRGITAALLVLGIVGLAVVFLVLPKWVGGPQPARSPVATVTPAQMQPEVAKQEVDFAALAKAKQEAEDKRSSIDERLQKLRARAVEQWGGQEYPQVTAELSAADAQFTAREYIAASQGLDAVAQLLGALEKRAAQVLVAQLQIGAEALSAGRSADAKAAFELAAKIEPNNQEAVRGSKRAATLDQVLVLVTQAERNEKEGNLTPAAESFRNALSLDTQAPRAAAGLARVEARRAGDAFASAMARGFAALSKAEYTSARAAFEDARKIRPGATEVAQALAQVEQEQRTRIIAAKLAQARDLEATERWAEALKEYRAVLELDPTVAAATEGATRTTPRAALNEQLEMYLTQPERLFSQPVRAAARETLKHANAIASQGPLLKQQTATLSDWLKRADAPVRIALQSDNLTQVTVYRVGALGSFAERSLELAPGTYTIVGTRPGYRDVRREIAIMPGEAPGPILIRCEEKI